VAKGYSQVEGLDFDETYAPVARLESIRILLVYATYHGFNVTLGFRRQTECEPCTCQDQQFTYIAVT
jgi:hypothetical protein